MHWVVAYGPGPHSARVHSPSIPDGAGFLPPDISGHIIPGLEGAMKGNRTDRSSIEEVDCRA